ncbi:sensor histidine kinase [Oceanisphaera sp. KMM 10153]|uniref:sensor histidine kinase n=1 Tax=Oceanisphaera submarina TaxID=3390193 RepID=UPI003975B3A5
MATNSPRSRYLSSQYLWLSLLVALVPLLSFTTLYDSYFAQLVKRITDDQLKVQLAATRNEFRTHLHERRYELEALLDQFDSTEMFTREGYHTLSLELKSLLRLQLDNKAIYGIAFFDADENLLWSFPEQALNQTRYRQMLQHPASRFDSVDLIGPEEHSWNAPPAVLMRKKMTVSSLSPPENAPFVALILRFNTLASIPRNLQRGGVYKTLLRTPDGRSYDTVGQPASPAGRFSQHDLVSGWTLLLVQNSELTEPPSARMRYWLIGLVAGTAISLLLLHWYLSRRLKRQVDVLVHSVEQVANGDLETPVEQLSSIEIGRLTQAVERMREQLKQVISSTVDVERQASLGQLAAGLAHDIRNPLTTILTTIQTLVRREHNPVHKDMLEMVEEEIERVNEVITNLLNFARPRPPQAELIRVDELYEGLVALANASARRQQVTLEIACNAGLCIYADAGHMRQILMNLILNALQSMQATGGHIRLTAIQDDGEIVLTVTDNGPGIPSELLPRITEPFFTTREAGTGLGLAICQVLAANNNATLHIRSQAGQGTSIELYCPVPDERKHNDE